MNPPFCAIYATHRTMQTAQIMDMSKKIFLLTLIAVCLSVTVLLAECTQLSAPPRLRNYAAQAQNVQKEEPAGSPSQFVFFKTSS